MNHLSKQRKKFPPRIHLLLHLLFIGIALAPLACSKGSDCCETHSSNSTQTSQADLLPSNYSSQAHLDAIKKRVADLSESLLSFNKPGFLSCLSGSEADVKAAETFIDFTIAIQAFKTAVKTAYGDDAWRRFEDEEGILLKFDQLDLRNKLDELVITFDQGKAQINLKELGKPITMIYKDDQWYFEANKLFVQDASMDRQVKNWQLVTQLLKKKHTEINQTKPTIDDLEDQLLEEYLSKLEE